MSRNKKIGIVLLLLPVALITISLGGARIAGLIIGSMADSSAPASGWFAVLRTILGGAGIAGLIGIFTAIPAGIYFMAKGERGNVSAPVTPAPVEDTKMSKATLVFGVIVVALIALGLYKFLTLPSVDSEDYMENYTSPTVLFGDWTWVYTVADSQVSPSTTTAPAGKFVITFGTDKQFSSTTDCNQLFGSFVLDGEVLSIGPIGATKMACIGDTLESVYVAELGRVASHTITYNDELHLHLVKDSGTMVFKKQ